MDSRTVLTVPCPPLDHTQGIGGIDPQIVVVAVGRIDLAERLAAVLGKVEAHVEHVQGLLIHGIRVNPRVSVAKKINMK